MKIFRRLEIASRPYIYIFAANVAYLKMIDNKVCDVKAYNVYIESETPIYIRDKSPITGTP